MERSSLIPDGGGPQERSPDGPPSERPSDQRDWSTVMTASFDETAVAGPDFEEAFACASGVVLALTRCLRPPSWLRILVTLLSAWANASPCLERAVASASWFDLALITCLVRRPPNWSTIIRPLFEAPAVASPNRDFAKLSECCLSGVLLFCVAAEAVPMPPATSMARAAKPASRETRRIDMGNTSSSGLILQGPCRGVGRHRIRPEVYGMSARSAVSQQTTDAFF